MESPAYLIKRVGRNPVARQTRQTNRFLPKVEPSGKAYNRRQEERRWRQEQI